MLTTNAAFAYYLRVRQTRWDSYFLDKEVGSGLHDNENNSNTVTCFCSEFILSRSNSAEWSPFLDANFRPGITFVDPAESGRLHTPPLCPLQLFTLLESLLSGPTGLAALV